MPDQRACCGGLATHKYDCYKVTVSRRNRGGLAKRVERDKEFVESYRALPWADRRKAMIEFDNAWIIARERYNKLTRQRDLLREYFNEIGF